MRVKKIHYEDNPKFLNEVINYLVIYKNYSNSSVSNLETSVIDFLKFINNNFKLNLNKIKEFKLEILCRINKGNIYSFSFYLLDKNLKLNTISYKITHLNTFFKVLYKQKKEIFINPIDDILVKELNINKLKKKEKSKVPKVLSLDQAKEMILVFNKKEKNYLNLRNKIIIFLFLNLGLRLSEVIDLKIEDIDLKENTILIYGKGKKERILAISQNLSDHIKEYLNYRLNLSKNNLNLSNEKYLFLSKKGNKMSETAVQSLVKNTYKEIGLDEKEYSVHTLRHTVASIMVKSGTDILVVKEILRT